MWQGLVFSLQILSSVWNKTHTHTSLINVRTWRSTCVKTNWTNSHTIILDMLKCCSAVFKMFIRISLVSWLVIVLWNTVQWWCWSALSMHYPYATYLYMDMCSWYTVPLLSQRHQVYFYQFNSFMSYLAHRTLCKHLIHVPQAKLMCFMCLTLLWWSWFEAIRLMYGMVAWSQAQCSLNAQTLSSLVSRAQHVLRKLWKWYSEYSNICRLRSVTRW